MRDLRRSTDPTQEARATVDHAGSTAPTLHHELYHTDHRDHTDHTDQECTYTLKYLDDEVIIDYLPKMRRALIRTGVGFDRSSALLVLVVFSTAVNLLIKSKRMFTEGSLSLSPVLSLDRPDLSENNLVLRCW